MEALRNGVAGWMCAALLPLLAPGAAGAAAEVRAADGACPADVVPVGAFPDAAGSVHAGAVDCIAWHGIARGASMLSYAPTAPVRRDQMATFLARLLEVAGTPPKSADEETFTDLAGNPHADNVVRLAAAGIVEGVATGRFEPATPVRRGQMASLLLRSLEHLTGAALPSGDDAFSDDDGNAHEAAIDALAQAGVTAGVSPDRYRPGGTVTRAQMAAFLTRALDLLAADGRLEVRTTPTFAGSAAALPSELRERMTGRSWRSGCPVSLDGLALLTMTHRGFDDRVHHGWMVVAESAAEDVLTAFAAVFDAGFPIERMHLVDDYGASDEASMEANNTSAFNCRRTTGGSGFSEHSYGTAIDLNPVQNPYVRGDTVLPASGSAYVDRTEERPGMITPSGPVVAAFAGIGWSWGGDYRTLKDYQHFSRSGR